MRGYSFASFVVLLAALATGCAANRPIQIDSTPSSAKVFRGGALIGTTPFTTDINVLFPNRAYDLRPSTSAVLLFRKEGYESSSYTVSEFSTPDVIKVELIPLNQTSTQNDGIAERLKKLQSLRNRGLITEDEYQQKRHAILDDL